jgi:hypothetical protein
MSSLFLLVKAQLLSTAEGTALLLSSRGPCLHLADYPHNHLIFLFIFFIMCHKIIIRFFCMSGGYDEEHFSD